MKKAIAIILVLFFSAGICNAQNLDIDLLKPINKTETTFKNAYFNTTADLVTPLSFAVPASVAIAGFATHNNRLKKDALYMAGSYVGSALVTNAIKHTVKRQRPYQKYSFILRRTAPDDNVSFPSGHTSAAFATATSVALRYRKWYFVTPAYMFAGSVAWARMYQGVHYPSDVLAGAVVGTASAWLSYKAQTKWFVKKSNYTASPNPSF